jgi:hypothetical protein
MGIEVSNEANFRGAMASYNMKPGDIDCMVEVVTHEHPLYGGLSGDVLQAAAKQCGIDTSKLRRSGD